MFTLMATKGLTFQLYPVHVLQQAVQDPVCNCRFAESFVPHRNWQLARDDGGTQPDAVLDHLEQVGSLVGGERPQQEVIEDQDVGAGPSGHQPREPAVCSSESDLVVQPRLAQV